MILSQLCKSASWVSVWNQCSCPPEWPGAPWFAAGTGLHSGVPGKDLYQHRAPVWVLPVQRCSRTQHRYGHGAVPKSVGISLPRAAAPPLPLPAASGQGLIFPYPRSGTPAARSPVLRLQRLHSKPRPDVDPHTPGYASIPMHPANRLQLLGDHPRHQLSGLFSCRAPADRQPALRQPAGQAVRAKRAASAALPFLPWDIEIDLTAALAAQDSRDTCNLKLDFFHNGSSPFWGRCAPFFSMIAQAAAKHKQEKLMLTRF